MTRWGIARGLKVGQWSRISAGSVQYSVCQRGGAVVRWETAVAVQSLCDVRTDASSGKFSVEWQAMQRHCIKRRAYFHLHKEWISKQFCYSKTALSYCQPSCSNSAFRAKNLGFMWHTLSKLRYVNVHCCRFRVTRTIPENPRPRGDLARFFRGVYKVAPRRLVTLWALVGFSPLVYQVALWAIRLAALIDLYARISNYHDLRHCHSTLVRTVQNRVLDPHLGLLLRRLKSECRTILTGSKVSWMCIVHIITHDVGDRWVGSGRT